MSFDKCLLQSNISCVKPWHAMCFRENGASKRAYKLVCKCYYCFSWCKVSLIHGNQHSFTLSPGSYRKLSLFSKVKTQSYLRNQHSKHLKKHKTLKLWNKMKSDICIGICRRWMSIPATFLEQTCKQLEVIWELVWSGVTN